MEAQPQTELSLDSLVKIFQKNTQNIRNICVLAHVDHGKTSLVDSLISYNNIISPRLAGDVRYMDSRPDEQERCITMKSSSISIAYHSETKNDNYLVNLIDSPGHVDFSYEIFSALKMVDGALILIDVIEGICSQTESVIRQAWDEKIKCVLVFNKIDKLITTVQLDPLEAYEHLYNLLEKVNALMSSLILRDLEINHLNNTNNLNRKVSKESNNSDGNNEINLDNIIEQKENDFYFSPDKGNVIFASALDNWAFTLDTFSEILSNKFKFKKEVLKKVLWGDYYYSPKTKKIYKTPPSEKIRPIFVEFVLENIYKMYKMVTIEKNFERVQSIVKNLKTNITSKELNKNNLEKNPLIILRTIMRQWLPIPQTIFEVLIDNLPNPIEGLKNKFELLFPHQKYIHNEFVTELKQKIINGQVTGENIPTVAYISKMVAIDIKNIQGEEYIDKTTNEVKFMAFARVFSGEIKKGDELFVIGPKHDAKNNNYDIIKFKFDSIYYFMGQYLNKLDIVPVGNIFSVGGLEKNVFKTATVSSHFNCPSIIPLNLNKNSNIKVSITAENIKEIPLLLEGLKKLNRSDPAVEYYMQSNGEHILVTSGEVHLERCLKDLENYLPKVKISTSAPIVNFKEGLSNTNYIYKKMISKKNEKLAKIEEDLQEVKSRERKMDLDENYVVVDGEKDIDIQDQKEILKSSKPMIITVNTEKKNAPKVAKHKVKDVISKNEKKTIHFIEKTTKTYSQKGFAEDTTPNKICTFGISAVGMTQKTIDIIEKNQKLIDNVELNGYEVDKETYDGMMTFKKELEDSIESKKLQKNVINYIYSLGTKDGRINMLIIKHISKRMNYFNRIKLEKDEETIDNSMQNLQVQEDITKIIDATINSNLQGTTTVKEFLDSVKIGFERALKNGPLCEENMYGCIFIIEHINFNKKDIEENSKEVKEDDKNKEEDKKNEIKEDKPEKTEIKNDFEYKKEDIKNDIPNSENLKKEAEPNTSIQTLQNDLVSPKKDKDQESKSLASDNQKEDSLSQLTKTQLNTYGPFLGQIMSTVQDCCRKAYLCGDPRLYEGLYLCFFQINQENVGKIHSVINKRRGEIIDEIPSEESIKCTIEAVVPVAESFGFVEEIRKKSSGLANPMLQFYKWKLLDVDPFDIATEEEINNFGVNINTSNIAKTYINKIRQRKGLVTDEKLIKGADKQRSLAKKR